MIPLPGLRFLSFAVFGGSLAPAALPAVAAPDRRTTGVAVSYQLPTDGPLPRTYGVTLAIVDPEHPEHLYPPGHGSWLTRLPHARPRPTAGRRFDQDATET
jgi:hypothetical protein